MMVEGSKERNPSPFSWLESPSWKEWKRVGLTGLVGSSKAYFLSHWRERVRGPLLIVFPHLRNAESFLEDLRFFQGERNEALFLFPEWETLPYDEIPPHPEIVGERVRSLFSLLRGEEIVVLSSIKALMQKVLSPSELKESLFSLSAGREVNREQIIHFLQKTGYSPARIVEETGDFSLRGAIIDVYSPFYKEPLRFEFDGDRLESIRRFDPETQRSLSQETMGEAILLPARDVSKDFFSQSSSTLLEYLKKAGTVFIEEGDDVEKEAEAFFGLIEEHYMKALSKRGSVPPPDSNYLSPEELSLSLEKFQTVFLQEGPVAPPRCQHVFSFEMETNEDLRQEMRPSLSAKESFHETSPFSFFIDRLRGWQEKGLRVLIISHTEVQAERLRDLLSHYDVVSYLEKPGGFREAFDRPEKPIALLIGPLSSGFRNPKEGWVLLTEEEIFGERRRRREGRTRPRTLETGGSSFTSYRELREEDFIVHIDYGVGLYKGLRHLKIEGVSNDYLLLEYLDGDKLFVPVDRLNLIQPYIGGDRRAKLDKLGSSSWQRTKRRVKAAISEMVKEILDLYAARKIFKGFSFSPLDQHYREFEATFEYEETPDQIKAIEEVMEDMGNPKPMDRLICGDVGYGKTEVAIRSAYRAVMNGKQVAVLVPTTVLAQQHHQTFSARFKNYPVIIEMLSRFKNPLQQKQILKGLREGRVDIVIGTHRLLQKDVSFRDLGLVVIDEEHRFGVHHKEKLKQMRKLVDVITLTATPIPRTLQMTISGIRDLSLIQTPPENRLSIRSFVVRYDDEVIREAVLRELHRGGQVFFVHHRVQNIHSMANHLKQLIPEASLAIAHGQMKVKELEKVMFQFVTGKYNLLLCTSIIESGLDIPTANTILINHAEQFGLADLYQLRGRVGRGSHQAYAYLLIPSELTLSKDAMRRLRAIQELSELGSGFKLAMHDLEIRGAGNLLGPSQSGHIAAVGFELYTQLMEKAVRQLNGEEVMEEITPEIHFRLPAFIPESYVEDPAERLSLYRRLSLCRSDEEVEVIREEMVDRFGRIPMELSHLLEVIKVKILLTKLSISRLEETPSQWVLTFNEATRVSPQRVVELIHRGKGKYRLTPDSKLIIERWPETKPDSFGAAKKLLQALA
jgi:transcription-repair coupling factor (superfamily II helicase)